MNEKQYTWKWEKDIEECSYESPADFLWFYILNGCGCGMSETLKQKAWDIFLFFCKDITERDYDFIAEDLLNETLAQWLDSKNLLEHGSNIVGSWLSEEGSALFKALKDKPNSEDGPIRKVNVGML